MHQHVPARVHGSREPSSSGQRAEGGDKRQQGRLIVHSNFDT